MDITKKTAAQRAELKAQLEDQERAEKKKSEDISKKHLEVKRCMMKHLRFGRYMQKNGSIRMGFR